MKEPTSIKMNSFLLQKNKKSTKHSDGNDQNGHAVQEIVTEPGQLFTLFLTHFG